MGTVDIVVTIGTAGTVDTVGTVGTMGTIGTVSTIGIMGTVSTMGLFLHIKVTKYQYKYLEIYVLLSKYISYCRY